MVHDLSLETDALLLKIWTVCFSNLVDKQRRASCAGISKSQLEMLLKLVVLLELRPCVIFML